MGNCFHSKNTFPWKEGPWTDTQYRYTSISPFSFKWELVSETEMKMSWPSGLPGSALGVVADESPWCLPLSGGSGAPNPLNISSSTECSSAQFPAESCGCFRPEVFRCYLEQSLWAGKWIPLKWRIFWKQFSMPHIRQLHEYPSREWWNPTPQTDPSTSWHRV